GLSPGSDVPGHLERFPGGTQGAAGTTWRSAGNSVDRGEDRLLRECLRVRLRSARFYYNSPSSSRSRRSTRDFATRTAPGLMSKSAETAVGARPSTAVCQNACLCTPDESGGNKSVTRLR